VTLRRTFLILAMLPLLLGAARTETPVPDTKRLDYVIKRDGDPIGTHVITFKRHKGDLLVDTRIKVAVRILFVTVYRYEKTARETWRDGRITAYRADTDDNGDPIKGRVVLTPEGLAAEGPKGKVIASPGTMISGYWNMATVKQTTLIDSEDVSLVPIRVEGGAAARVTLGAQTFETRHFRITGELARELWYDRQGLLVKMRTIGSDGSVIDTDRKTP
jgi:hypothetical protein